MQTKFTGLTDSQWQYIEKILEKEQGKGSGIMIYARYSPP